jgi:acyl-lipid omega-6 desaturase (Delta-12 desaturase)
LVTASAPDSLAALRAVIPAYCLRPDTRLAVRSLVLGFGMFAVSAMFAGWTFAAQLVWLHPVAWWVSGMAVLALFVLGHDCGHQNLLRSRRLMVVLGHWLLLPAGYPFYMWKHSHDAHHANANRLGGGPGVYFDNAWSPLTVEDYQATGLGARLFALVYEAIHVFPPLGSLLHVVYFSLSPWNYRSSHRRDLFLSWGFLLVVGGPIAAGLFALGGFHAILHFWIMPALCFQLWMGLYTFVHHTAEDLPWFEADEWTPLAAQLATVNCRFPEWISRPHFRIDVHIPHHISTAIPSYHLIAANHALHESPFASQIREFPITGAYVVRQVRTCQLWDRERRVYAQFH